MFLSNEYSHSKMETTLSRLRAQCSIPLSYPIIPLFKNDININGRNQFCSRYWHKLLTTSSHQMNIMNLQHISGVTQISRSLYTIERSWKLEKKSMEIILSKMRQRSGLVAKIHDLCAAPCGLTAQKSNTW